MKFLDTFTVTPQSAVLSNGIRVFFRKTLPSGLVSVRAWVQTGSIHEGEFLGGGLSHFLEHMVFKGTEKFSADEISRQIQAVGGALNAYTTFSRTVFYADVPAEAAETAFEILSQMTLFPRLDSADAKLEKNVILREIDMGRDDPDSHLADETFAEAFRVHPYRVPVIGYRDVFSQMGVEELRSYIKTRYTPSNIAVVVAGDIEASVVFDLAEKYFSSVPARPTPPVFVPTEPPQTSPRELTLHGNVNVLRGNMLWKIPSATHADTPALSVLAAILGKGDSSLLWQELHEKRGIVHSLDVSTWSPNDIGLFWISYDAELDARREIEETLHSEIEKIATAGVDASLLKKAVRQATVALVNSASTASAAAGRLGIECVEQGNPNSAKNFLEKINTLTPDDIRIVARKYLRETTQTTSAFERPVSPKKISEKKSAPKTTGTSALPPFHEVQLSCGIRALFQPVQGLPKVHLRATMLGGGSFETEKTKGASALLSTLMTLDAGSRDAKKIAEEIESIGGVFGEISGNNSISLFTETLAGDENIACEILANALAAPRFSEENFLRERDSQLAALQSEFDEIKTFASIALRKEFFGKHALGTHNFGTEKSLSELKLPDIEEFYKKLAAPGNIVIAASGEFDEKRLLATLEEKFSRERFLKKPAQENFISAFEKFTPSAAREKELASPLPAKQAIVQLAFPDAGICDEHFHFGEITEELLSGISSRLFLEVREKRGLAYFVGASRIVAPFAGMFYLRAGTEKGKTEIVREEMRKELDRLRAGEISKEELDGAKTRILVAKRSARQRASVRCSQALLNAIYGLPVNDDAEFEAKIRSATADDIARFANEFLAPKHEFSLLVK